MPKEVRAGERRVALTPSVVKQLSRRFEIIVEEGAGLNAHFSDDEYKEAGAKIGKAEEVFSADIVVKVQRPVQIEGRDEISLMKENSVLVCFLNPFFDPETTVKLAQKKLTLFAMELVPRTTRAQVVDALSSQATVTGYVAVLWSASRLPRFFPMLMTAAGTIRPAKVLVVGTAVAGLQAIATARRLGAVVKGADIRPQAKGEVESLGATFLQMPAPSQDVQDKYGYAREIPEEFYAKQQEFLLPHVKEADVVITTAQIPGRPAPKLITESMVKQMKAGSVIVDTAVDTGGNCTLSEAGKVVQKYGVTIYGFSNPPSALPQHASEMYARNIANFIREITEKDQLKIDTEKNEIVREMLVARDGEIVSERVKPYVERR